MYGQLSVIGNVVLTVLGGGVVWSGGCGGRGAVRVTVVDGGPGCGLHHQWARVHLRVLSIL